MEKEVTTLSKSERARIEKLRNEIIGFVEEQPIYLYDDDDEEYDDYNTDDPSPVDEEPVYDTAAGEERLYRLYREAILQTLN